MPEYDDNAAAFFGITILALYLVPATISIVSTIRNFDKAKQGGSQAGRTRLEAAKLKRVAEEEASKRVLWTRGFKIFVYSTVALGVLFCYLLWTANGNTTLAAYDPFVILGVGRDATEKEIKKAYRELSRTHHPDLGGSNEMFQKVAKAYEALTDETARHNYEHYGNPDGPKALEVSIGLPSWIMGGIAQYAVLLSYLAVLVVGVPIFMFRSYRKRSTAGKVMGVDQGTIAWVVLRMQAHGAELSPSHVPELVAGAKENADLAKFPLPEAEMEEVRSLMQEMVASKAMPALPKIDRAVISPDQINLYIILLHAHQNRKIIRSANLRKVQQEVLKNADRVLEVVVQYCIEQCIAFSKQDEAMRRDRSVKIPKDKIVPNFLPALISAVQGKQLLVQALSVRDSSLRTLLSPEDIKHIAAQSRKTGRVDTLFEYLRLPEDQRYYAGVGETAKKAAKDQNSAAAAFMVTPIADEAELKNVMRDLPDLDVSAKVYVQGYDNIAEGDICTLDLVMSRKGVREESKEASVDAPAAYAPYWPVPRDEEWVVLLLDEWNRIMRVEKIKDKESKLVNKLTVQFPAPDKAGPHEFRILIKSATYVGLDLEIPVHLQVSPAASVAADEEMLAKEKARDKKSRKASGKKAEDDSDEEEDKDKAAATGIAGSQSLIDGYLMGGQEDESDVSDSEGDSDGGHGHSHSGGHGHSHGGHGHSHGSDDSCDSEEAPSPAAAGKKGAAAGAKKGKKAAKKAGDSDSDFDLSDEPADKGKKNKKPSAAEAKRQARQAKKAAAAAAEEDDDAELAGGLD